MPAPTSLVTLRGPHFPAEIGKKRKGGRLASPKGLISQKLRGRGLQFLELRGDDSPYTSEEDVLSERGSCLQSLTQRSPRPGATHAQRCPSINSRIPHFYPAREVPFFSSPLYRWGN